MVVDNEITSDQKMFSQQIKIFPMTLGFFEKQFLALSHHSLTLSLSAFI